MNSDPNSDLNSAQNSALHQVRSCALRAHGVCSRTYNAQVARTTCAGRAHSPQVVGASRDLLDDQARSRRQSHVATSLLPNQNCPGRDLKNGVATLVSIGQLEPCRDINRCRDTTQATPGRNTKTRSRPSWRLPYVATSISCRDLVSAHSGISRSRQEVYVLHSYGR